MQPKRSFSLPGVVTVRYRQRPPKAIALVAVFVALTISSIGLFTFYVGDKSLERCGRAAAAGMVVNASIRGDMKPRREGHYALCFYGLLRSLNWTIDSVVDHVLEPIAQAGGTYDVFVHTYRLRELINPHADEHTTDTHLKDLALLNATRYLVTDQDDFDATIPDLSPYYDNFRWNYDELTMRNVLRAQNSLASVWAVMANFAAEHDVHYDGVVVLRPDMLYLTDIDIMKKDTVTEGLYDRTVYLPDFQHWGGVNDRFAFGSTVAMRVYSNRAISMLRPRGLWGWLQRRISKMNTEKFLLWHLKDNCINVSATTTLRCARLRSSGRVTGHDTAMVTEACEAGEGRACIALAKRLDHRN